MWNTIINTVITIIVSGTLGYCVNVIKNYKKKIENNKKNENIQNMALLTLLKGTLANTHFVYSEFKKIPDYVYQNFLDTLEVYENLGGDGFIHAIAKKMEDWEIVKTDILTK